MGINRRKNGLQCYHEQCVDNFRTIAAYAESVLIEIREAGVLGKGAFAKADIPQYQLLGEYLGELIPENWVVSGTDAYTFGVPGEFIISKSPSAFLLYIAT